MKKLQNNYTTPEQSKLLLELGVPADSADCFYSSFIKSYPYSEHKEQVWQRPRFITEDNNPDFNATELYGYSFYFPCWSVGRLIEIWNICVNLMPGMQLELDKEPGNCTYIELIVASFELAVDDGLIYFSNLED